MDQQLDSNPVVYDFSQFKTKSLHYNNPSRTSGGSYLGKSYLKLDNKKVAPFYIQLPRIKCSNLSLQHPDSRNYMEFELQQDNLDLYEFISELDDHNINLAYRNSTVWFQQNLPMDTIDDFYRSVIKPKRGSKPPNFKVRVPTQKGTILTHNYNSERQMVDLRSVHPGDELSIIVQIVGLRFLKQQFLCELHLIQSKHYPVSTSIPKNYLFLDSDNTSQKLPELSNMTDFQEIDPSQVDADTVHLNFRKFKVDTTTDKDLTESNNVTDDNVDDISDNNDTDVKENVEESLNDDETNVDNVEEVVSKETTNTNTTETIDTNISDTSENTLLETEEGVTEEKEEILERDTEETEETEEIAKMADLAKEETEEIATEERDTEDTVEKDIIDTPETITSEIVDDNKETEVINNSETSQIKEKVNLEEDDITENVKDDTIESRDIDIIDYDSIDDLIKDEDIDSVEIDDPDLQEVSLEEVQQIDDSELEAENEKEMITIKNNYEEDIEMIQNDIDDIQEKLKSLQSIQEQKNQELQELKKMQEEPEFQYFES